MSRLQRRRDEADFWFMNLKHNTAHIAVYFHGRTSKSGKNCLFYAFFFWIYKSFTSEKCYCLDIKQLLMNLCGSVGTLTVAFSLRCVESSSLELFELQALAHSHAIHINFQRIYFQIYFLLLQHLSVKQVAKRCFRLKHQLKFHYCGKRTNEKTFPIKRKTFTWSIMWESFW